MKKKLLLLSNVILLSSCNVFVNNNLPNEKKTIVGDFGNIVKDKVTITDENGHDFSNQKLMVEIYYKDETKTEIDHVFVTPAKLVEITFSVISPCSEPDDIELYSEKYNVYSLDVKYVCNEDLTYSKKRTIEGKNNIYASYQKFEKNTNSYTDDDGTIYVIGLFSYLPR